MVVVMISGTVITDVRESKTASGVDRATFTIESEDQGSLPLRYDAITFGKVAERALYEIKPGSMITCFGRFSAGGPEKKISLTVSGFEVLAGALANAQ
jgi:hypothetical protein